MLLHAARFQLASTNHNTSLSISPSEGRCLRRARERKKKMPATAAHLWNHRARPFHSSSSETPGHKDESGVGKQGGGGGSVRVTSLPSKRDKRHGALTAMRREAALFPPPSSSSSTPHATGMALGGRPLIAALPQTKAERCQSIARRKGADIRGALAPLSSTNRWPNQAQPSLNISLLRAPIGFVAPKPECEKEPTSFHRGR